MKMKKLMIMQRWKTEVNEDEEINDNATMENNSPKS